MKTRQVSCGTTSFAPSGALESRTATSPGRLLATSTQLGVLRHVVGSPSIMRTQLDKLAELAHEPGLMIQVLPFTASDHPGTDGPILVYDFDGAPSVAPRTAEPLSIRRGQARFSGQAGQPGSVGLHQRRPMSQAGRSRAPGR